MKKVNLFAAIAASIFILVSASVWEGAADIGEDLPENEFFLATNSFPVKTIVEVVNLENNKSKDFIVSAPLDNSKLLALLSRDAAGSIGLNNMGRIRMKEKDDLIAYSGLAERSPFSVDPNYTSDLDGYDLAFALAEPRPPEDWRVPDPDKFIPSITTTTPPPIIYEPPVIAVIPPVPQFVIPPPASASTSKPYFSVPLIQSFERGSYYVQIGAYEKTQTVESEILKIDKNLPVAGMETVMTIGNAEKLVYRVLIGPLNLGESGTVFQKYKAIYKDAFLRVGI